MCAVLALLFVGAQASADPAPAGMVKLQPNSVAAPSQLVLDAEGVTGGLEPGQVPTGLTFSLQRGFTIDPTAPGAVCTNAQATASPIQCPKKSQFAAGTIGVTLSGAINDHTTADVVLYIAPPQVAGDPAGAVFWFSAPKYSFSGSMLGRIETLAADPTYGTEIAFDKLPIPPLPPGLQITLNNIKLTTLAPGSSGGSTGTGTSGSGGGGGAGEITLFTHRTHLLRRNRFRFALAALPRTHGRLILRNGHTRISKRFLTSASGDVTVTLKLPTRLVRRLRHARHITFSVSAADSGQAAAGSLELLARPRARAAAGGAFLTNPATCSGSWAARLQVIYASGTQDREAQVPCTS